MAAKTKFSSTPASVIYAQSWPVPTANSFSQRFPAKANSNSQTRSLDNSPWIGKQKRRVKRPQKDKVASPAIHKSPSWASSMLSSNYPEWLENDGHVVLDIDMAKEFKMTLQMFKKLTDQVKEVDEQLNSYKKPYSFKHYFSTKNHYKTRRTNIRSYTPEIPMTNEEYQPCNNLGFQTVRQQPPNRFGVYRKADKLYPNSSNSKHEIWSSPNARNLSPTKWQGEESLVNESDDNFNPGFQNEHPQKEASTDLDYLYNDGDIFWSSCLEFSDEDNHEGLGYIDPVPEDWEVRKLEELELEYSPDKSGRDPFMFRYLQLRRLEIETVEQERGNGNNTNFVPALEIGLNKVTISNKGKKTTCSKKQSSKINGAFENAEKNPQKVLKQSSTSSLQDFEKYNENNVRNLKKESKDFCKKVATDIKQRKIESNERRSKSAKGRRRVQSCKSRPASHSPLVTYNILELATTFDPPSKERIKLNARPVTAKSAKSKGMIPGKTWSSQRRFSLTAGQSLQSLPDNGDSVIRKSRTSSATKHSKKNTKRCSSSKF